MPRPLVALLLASLLGNAALVLVVARRSTPDATPPPAASPTSAGASHASTSSAAPSAASSSADPSLPPVPPEIAAILSGQDPARFHALLLAAGLDKDVRQQLVQALLWKQAEPRFRAIDPTYFGGKGDDPTWWKDSAVHETPELRKQRETVDQLQQELAEEVARITGVDPKAYDPEDNVWLARQYAGLPREKAEALYRIDQDYQELESEIRRATEGFELASDREKLRLLKAERERDVAALLTPEERAAWELRSSPTAQQLRYRMGQLDATEDEYRQIYALQKIFDDRYNRDDQVGPYVDPSENDPDYWKRRNAEQEQLEERIRAIIGPERVAAAQLENNYDYTTARDAAARLGLPPETAKTIVALRAPAAAESRRIADDPALTSEQKSVALAALAAETREQVERSLGAEGAQAYFERNAMSWLKELERGDPVSPESDEF